MKCQHREQCLTDTIEKGYIKLKKGKKLEDLTYTCGWITAGTVKACQKWKVYESRETVESSRKEGSQDVRNGEGPARRPEGS